VRTSARDAFKAGLNAADLVLEPGRASFAAQGSPQPLLFGALEEATVRVAAPGNGPADGRLAADLELT